MKAAVAQIDCLLGDAAANCAKAAEYVRRAAEQGCRLIVLPETIDTGYEIPTILAKASPWTGPPLAAMTDAAASAGIHMICGLTEREGDRIFNSAAVLSPTGELTGRYRKTHLFSADPVNEDRYLAAGDSLEVVRIDDMNFGLMICYDLRFPEMARSLVLKGADVLVVCSAWPFPREAHWNVLLRARAIENQCYVIAANRVGTHGELTFCGSSCIIDPWGKELAVASPHDEELLTAGVRRDTVASVREQISVMQDRRVDLYHRSK